MKSILSLTLAMSLAAISSASALMRSSPSQDPAGVRRATVAILGPEGACSGTLIGPRLVVTAAHCLQAGGTYRVRFLDQAFRGRNVAVQAVARHPEFVRIDGFSPNDVGLVALKAPLPPFMHPVALGSTGWFGGGEDSLIAGFGSTEVRRSKAGVLRETMLRAHEPPVSGRGFRGLTGEVGGPDRGMCVGDSGGPVFRGKGESLVLIGILKGGVTQRGTDCTAHPIYTPVSDFRAWIEAQSAQWGVGIGQ